MYHVHPEQSGKADDGVWFIDLHNSDPSGPLRKALHYLVVASDGVDTQSRPLKYAVLLHHPIECTPHDEEARDLAEHQSSMCLEWLTEQVKAHAPGVPWSNTPASFTLFTTFYPFVGMTYRAANEPLDADLLKALHVVLVNLSKTWPEWMPPVGEA